MQHSYTEILMQWIFLFVLMSIIIVPALMFRKIALRNNRKGWIFFLFGLAVGFLALQIGRLTLLLLVQLDIPKQYAGYLAVFLVFIIGHAIVITAVKLLRQKLNDRKPS